MAWDTMADSEVDANSPLNTTLMTKYRDNDNALAASYPLYSAGAHYILGVLIHLATEVIVDAAAYVPVIRFSEQIWLPSWAANVVCSIDHYFDDDPSTYTQKEARLQIDDDGGGWDDGSDVTVPKGDYDNAPGPGQSVVTGVTNPGRWADFRIQARQTSGNNETYHVRSISIRVTSILP